MDDKKGNVCKRVGRFVYFKKQSECMHLCQSLTSVGNRYIFFSHIKRPTLHYCLKGSCIICFVKGYFLFKCVKANNYG